MELDITHMMDDCDEMPMLSGSRAELGQDAGKITWNNSLDYASSNILLTDETAMDEARQWLKDFGAWDANEIAGFSDNELNALVVQFIAGDIRTMGDLCGTDSEFDEDEYRKLSEEGAISGNIYRSDDGRWYFYLGN